VPVFTIYSCSLAAISVHQQYGILSISQSLPLKTG